MLLFIFLDKNSTLTETINIEGTWKVATFTDNGIATIVDGEYMVFDPETVNDYRNNDDTPYVTSKYTIDNSMSMHLTDISKTYTVEKNTDNYVRLYENENTYIDLIRYANEDMSPLNIDISIITEKWDVIYRHTSNIYTGEYIVFDNGNISHYRGDSDAPIATSSYSWKDGNHLIVDAWEKDMILYPISSNTIIFVETFPDYGFIWELKKND